MAEGLAGRRFADPLIHPTSALGRPVNPSLATASSDASASCPQALLLQRLRLCPPGASTQLSSHYSPLSRSPPTAGPYSLPLTAAAARSSTSPRVSGNRTPPTASVWMPPAPQGSFETPCAPTRECSAAGAGSASRPA
jgi:hypothetical protein